MNKARCRLPYSPRLHSAMRRLGFVDGRGEVWSDLVYHTYLRRRREKDSSFSSRVMSLRDFLSGANDQFIPQLVGIRKCFNTLRSRAIISTVKVLLGYDSVLMPAAKGLRGYGSSHKWIIEMAGYSTLYYCVKAMRGGIIADAPNFPSPLTFSLRSSYPSNILPRV